MFLLKHQNQIKRTMSLDNVAENLTLKNSLNQDFDNKLVKSTENCIFSLNKTEANILTNSKVEANDNINFRSKTVKKKNRFNYY